MKLILLNGPPRSGKDTAAHFIRNYFSPTHSIVWEKFSLPHKLAFAAMLKKPINYFGDVEYFEQHKSETIPGLGVSYRQWQIDFSEKFMKPLYGRDIFAKLFLLRTQLRRDEPKYICLVSDCGFQVEVDTVLQSWPSNEVLLLRLHREGTSFEGDSREYVSGPLTIQRNIVNNGPLEQFREAVLNVVIPFINPEEGA